MKYSKIASQSRQLPLISPTHMCLIIFAHRAIPSYPLVVAANRDEFFPRPTQQADFWAGDGPSAQLLAGRDLQAGGTWLGIDRSGRFAAVTNVRDPSQQEDKPRSRGELPVNFLTARISAREYCQSLDSNFGDYAGYNLLVGDKDSMFYVNNLDGIIEELEAGIYGLSNGNLNSSWPKVTQGRDQLGALLEQPDKLMTDHLITMMSDRHQASDAELPDTGVPLEMERQLSATFIHNTEREYGTRCSTAIIMHDENGIRFQEQNYNADGLPSGNHYYSFNNADAQAA